MPPLTPFEADNAKARDKTYRLYDQRGLYLEVTPTGRKYWRLKYRFGGKEKRLALGVYPKVKIAQARTAAEIARASISQNVDPSAERRAKRQEQHRLSDAYTFRTVADEWLALQQTSWSENTFKNAQRRLQNYVYPYIGNLPISHIQPADVLNVIRRIENRDHIDTAHRVKQRCGQIFRYAIATGRADRDPAADLRGALAPLRTKHHAAVTEPTQVGGLLRSIAQYHGSETTRIALLLLAHTFVRPGELRKARWSEFDLESAIWRIPADRMKMKLAHLVPLSRQTVVLLRELQHLTGKKAFLFPSTLSDQRPISDNTLNTALRRLGYTKDEMTSHGFRTIASTLLHERGWHTDIIERQLAHIERNKVKGAYNRAQHLDRRAEMMQDWSDLLEDLSNN